MAAPKYNFNIGKRHYLELLRTKAYEEREYQKPVWRELGNLVLPTRPRFYTTDINKSAMRHNTNIVNGIATLASRSFVAGFKSGTASPAREWFKIAVGDQDMMNYAPVKRWCQAVTERMHARLLRSNFYREADKQYKDFGTFGVGAVGIQEDLQKTAHFHSWAIGEYAFMCDSKGSPNVWVSQWRMTVRQILDEYGEHDSRGNITNWENFSEYIRNIAENHGENLDTWVEVCWVVAPNKDYRQYGILSKHKRYASCVFETGSGETMKESYLDSSSYYAERYLSEKGFDRFPFMIPRWETTGHDYWPSDCPGMTALADIKQLQESDRRLGRAIEKMINPPLKAGVGMKNQKITLLPGEANFLQERDVKDGLAPVHEVQPPVNEMVEMIAKMEHRVSRAYFEDLFLKLALDERNQRATAAEVNAIERERIFTLGPVLDRMDSDRNDNLVDNLFDIMWRQGDIPTPPPEIEGMPLRVEYVSVMHQAQKMNGVANVERFIGTVGALIAGTNDMSVVDSINVDKLIQKYGDQLGLHTEIIRSDDEISAIREERAEAQAEQMQADQMEQKAKAVKDLGSTPMDSDNALTRIAALSQQPA